MWSPDVNFTKEAMDYKVNACMSKVLNGEYGIYGTCEEYYAGLAGTSDEMAAVTADDIATHCKTIKETWTAEGVKEYCTQMTEAQKAYWTGA